jgi:hypothetical protein
LSFASENTKLILFFESSLSITASYNFFITTMNSLRVVVSETPVASDGLFLMSFFYGDILDYSLSMFEAVVLKKV